MALKIIIKIGEKEHKFLVLSEDICKDIEKLKQFCYTRFPQLQTGAELRIFWIDQDGDEICVVTDDDYNSFSLTAAKDKRRLYVEATEATQVDASACLVESAPKADTNNDASRPVHQAIICDVCDREIEGHRYRCLTCYDYDLCMTCESKYRHKDHVMLRIPQPLRSKTVSHRVLEKMERYAAKLEFVPADDSVDGKKSTTAEVGHKAEKARDKARRAELARAASDHSYAEGKSKPPTSTKSGSSTKTRDQTKRFTSSSATSAIMKEMKRTRTEVAKEKAKERPSVPLAWVNDGDIKPHVCHSDYGHRSSCPYAIKPDAALSMPLESLPCYARKGKQANEAGPTSSSRKVCKTTVCQHPKAERQEGTAKVVSMVVDGVLKHTPPELKKFLPVDEELIRLGKKLTTLLDKLGLEPKTPPAETGEASSTGTAVAPAGLTVSEEANEEGERSVAVAGEDKELPVATVVDGKQETASEGGKPTLETDSVAVGASPDGATAMEEQQNGPAVDNEECSADTSSASMLTDDEEGDDLEAEQVSKQSNSSVAKEVPWILVDLPEDEVEQNEDNNSSTTPPATPVGAATPPASPEKEVEPMDIEEAEEKREEIDENAIRNLIEYTKTRLEMLKKKSPKEEKEVLEDKFKAVFEKLYKDLENLKDDQMAEESNEQMEKQNAGGNASVAEPMPEKENSPEAVTTSSPGASITTPAPSTSAQSASSNIAVLVPSTQPTAAPVYQRYSRRPRVNHAIHTMMTMGFSNNDGRLTQLLEALNGDIPRALDKLMPYSS